MNRSPNLFEAKGKPHGPHLQLGLLVKHMHVSRMLYIYIAPCFALLRTLKCVHQHPAASVLLAWENWTRTAEPPNHQRNREPPCPANALPESRVSFTQEVMQPLEKQSPKKKASLAYLEENSSVPCLGDIERAHWLDT